MRPKSRGLLGMVSVLALLSACSHDASEPTESVGKASEALSFPIGTPLITANFTLHSEGFTYTDNGFRGANAAAYANGATVSGGLAVDLGGIDAATVSGMSGGWSTVFVVNQPSRVIATFELELKQSPNYESDETSDALVSVDGALRGLGGKDYVARIVGDGEGGPDVTTGRRVVDVDLGVLPTGAHQLRIGGYNNKKTALNETTRIFIDNLRVASVPAVAPATTLSCDNASCCPAGKTVVNGTNNAEALTNNSADRCLVMMDGSDTVANYGSGSVVLGGNGDDTIMAGTGALVRGGPGRDTINGFTGGTIYGGPGDDIISGANGNSFIYPGAGADTVSAGTGNDTIVIYDLCEVSWGDQIDCGSGNDTLITPVPLATLQSMGVTVANCDNIVVQKNSCKSECAGNACSGNGQCIEGASAGQVKCDCAKGFSGPDCSVLGEPTVPVNVNPGIGTPIPGHVECTTSNLGFVNGDNPALPIDPAHPERRKIVYGSAAPGCEQKICTLVDGVETVQPFPTEAQLNAAPAASATCPAVAATLPSQCGVKKDSIQPGSCVNDVDCASGYTCFRVCNDETCKTSSKHCAQVSDSCKGMPAESANCDDTGLRFCSDQGPKRSSTEAELQQTPVTTTPATMDATKYAPDAHLAPIASVDGCEAGLPARNLERPDTFTRKDDGSSLFGIYLRPTLTHKSNFKPTKLADVSSISVTAQATFATGVKLFGKEYPAIEADAHAILSACQRDVRATFKVFGDELAATPAQSPNNGDEDTECKRLADKWNDVADALLLANKSAHEARNLFTSTGPNRGLCGKVKTALKKVEDGDVGINSLISNVKSTDLDCSATSFEATGTLVTNVLIDNYKRVQQQYLDSLAEYVARRAPMQGSGTLKFGEPTPFSVAGYSQQFFIGPIPILIEARIFGEYGVQGTVDWGLQLTGNNPNVFGKAGVTPLFALRASVFAGVGIPAASIGVEGDLLLIKVEPAFKVGMTLQGQKVQDTRDIGEWTGALLPGFPRQIANWQAPWSFGASLTLSTLDGHFDAVARLKLFFFTKTFRKQIFAWKGPSFTQELTAGGSLSPMARNATESDFGGHGDAVAYTGVANVAASEIPAGADFNAPFGSRIPGEPCVVVK